MLAPLPGVDPKKRIVDENIERDCSGKEALVVYMLDTSGVMKDAVGAMKEAMDCVTSAAGLVSSVHHALVLYGDFDSEEVVTVYDGVPEVFERLLGGITAAGGGGTNCEAFDFALQHVLRVVVPRYRKAGGGGSVLAFNITDEDVRLRNERGVYGSAVSEWWYPAVEIERQYARAAELAYDGLWGAKPPTPSELARQLAECDVWLRTVHGGAGKRCSGYVFLQRFDPSRIQIFFTGETRRYDSVRLGGFLLRQILLLTAAPLPLAEPIDPRTIPFGFLESTLASRRNEAAHLARGNAGPFEDEPAPRSAQVAFDSFKAKVGSLAEDVLEHVFFPADFGLLALDTATQETPCPGRSWPRTAAGQIALRTSEGPSPPPGPSLCAKVKRRVCEATARGEWTRAGDECRCGTCAEAALSDDVETSRNLAAGLAAARRFVKPMTENEAALEICALNPALSGAVFLVIASLAVRCLTVSGMLSELAKKHGKRREYHVMVESKIRNKLVFDLLARHHDKLPVGAVRTWLQLKSAESGKALAGTVGLRGRSSWAAAGRARAIPFREFPRMEWNEPHEWVEQLVWEHLAASPTPPPPDREPPAPDGVAAVPVFAEGVGIEGLADALGQEESWIKEAARACTVRYLPMLVSAQLCLPRGSDSAIAVAAIMGFDRGRRQQRDANFGALMSRLSVEFLVRETGCDRRHLDAGFDALLRRPHDDRELQKRQPLKSAVCVRSTLQLVAGWVDALAPDSNASRALHGMYGLLVVCSSVSGKMSDGNLSLRTRAVYGINPGHFPKGFLKSCSACGASSLPPQVVETGDLSGLDSSLSDLGMRIRGTCLWCSARNSQNTNAAVSALGLTPKLEEAKETSAVGTTLKQFLPKSKLTRWFLLQCAACRYFYLASSRAPARPLRRTCHWCILESVARKADYLFLERTVERALPCLPLALWLLLVVSKRVSGSDTRKGPARTTVLEMVDLMKRREIAATTNAAGRGCGALGIETALSPKQVLVGRTVVRQTIGCLPWKLVNDHVIPSVLGKKLPFSSWNEAKRASALRLNDEGKLWDIVENMRSAPPLDMAALCSDPNAVGKGMFDNEPQVWKQYANFSPLDARSGLHCYRCGGTTGLLSNFDLHPGGCLNARGCATHLYEWASYFLGREDINLPCPLCRQCTCITPARITEEVHQFLKSSFSL